MSDYGFATYDIKNHNRKIGIVNSKWPIFGPNYNDIKRGYKTYHFSDSMSRVPKNISYNLPSPSAGSSTFAYRYEKAEAWRVEHGFKKRPLGYVTFTGNVRKNVRGYIHQYNNNGSSIWGGQYELTGLNTAVIPVRSSIQGQMETAYTSSGYDPTAVVLRDSPFTIYDGSSYFPVGNLLVPTGTPSRVKTTYNLYNGNDPDDMPVPGGGLTLPPYSVEIDDKYIILYRNLYSCDVWYRTDSGSTQVYDRVKIADDFAGTEIDMTVLFCPYSMEDLL